MARLEAISARLEDPETGLEETIRLVEEGIQLVRNSRKMLDEAELRIKVLENPEEDRSQPTADSNSSNDGFTLL